MKRVTVIAFIFIVFPLGRVEAQSEGELLESARTHADQLLELLRLQEWEQAAEHVHISAALLRQLSLPSDAPNSMIVDRVEKKFRELYERLPPGAIESVRLSPESSSSTRWAFVTYHHGDLDGFAMRLVGNQWLYTVERY